MQWKWKTIATRIDRIEERAPKPVAPFDRDLSRLTDDEVDEMAAYTERIIAAGRPENPAALFTAAECERIAELIRKTEAPRCGPHFDLKVDRRWDGALRLEQVATHLGQTADRLEQPVFRQGAA